MGGTHDGVPIFILYNDSIHESWWMDFLSQINHAFNSSDFKIPYFIAQWSQKNSWNRQFPFPQWFYDFFSWDNLDNFSVWKLSINFPVTKCWSTSCKEDVSYSNPALITVIQIDHKATEIQKGHTWIFLTYLALNAK